MSDELKTQRERQSDVEPPHSIKDKDAEAKTRGVRTGRMGRRQKQVPHHRSPKPGDRVRDDNRSAASGVTRCLVVSDLKVRCGGLRRIELAV